MYCYACLVLNPKHRNVNDAITLYWGTALCEDHYDIDLDNLFEED